MHKLGGRRGGGGGRGAAAPQFQKSVKFFRQNAHYSGNTCNSWEKTFQRFQGLQATFSDVCLAKTDFNSNDEGCSYPVGEKPAHYIG